MLEVSQVHRQQFFTSKFSSSSCSSFFHLLLSSSLSPPLSSPPSSSAPSLSSLWSSPPHHHHHHHHQTSSGCLMSTCFLLLILCIIYFSWSLFPDPFWSVGLGFTHNWAELAQLPFCVFEVLAGFWIYRLIEQQVLCHLFSLWILHCRTLDSYTKKNHCLEYFGKNKSRHKSILAAASMWSSVMKLTMPCLCIQCLSHW